MAGEKQEQEAGAAVQNGLNYCWDYPEGGEEELSNRAQRMKAKLSDPKVSSGELKHTMRQLMRLEKMLSRRKSKHADREADGESGALDHTPPTEKGGREQLSSSPPIPIPTKAAAQ